MDHHALDFVSPNCGVATVFQVLSLLASAGTPRKLNELPNVDKIL
jgi:hypothetical protein